MEEANLSECRAAEAFERKLSLFFELHVLPRFQPEDIHWRFSLSGGKDSFAMAEGIRRWYAAHHLPFDASAFTIDQWGGAAHRAVASQVGWIDVEVLDRRAATRAATGYQPGQQAPCRACADVRRATSDELLARGVASRRVQLLARGLHLSDTAVSVAWRFAIGRDGARELIDAGKARPVAPLGDDAFLVKPLTFVRERESAAFARRHGFQPACCGCPACRFPSRRDIVEETVMGHFQGPLWEISVPGVAALVRHFGTDPEVVANLSAPGDEPKHAHLPAAFFRWTAERLRAAAPTMEECDPAIDLDCLGARRLRESAPVVAVDRIPRPALLSGRPLDPLEERMVATLGPFWGAIALAPEAARRAWELQERAFGIVIDERWSQVNRLLNDYYAALAVPQRTARFLPVVVTCCSNKGVGDGLTERRTPEGLSGEAARRNP